MKYYIKKEELLVKYVSLALSVSMIFSLSICGSSLPKALSSSATHNMKTSSNGTLKRGSFDEKAPAHNELSRSQSTGHAAPNVTTTTEPAFSRGDLMAVQTIQGISELPSDSSSSSTSSPRTDSQRLERRPSLAQRLFGGKKLSSSQDGVPKSPTLPRSSSTIEYTPPNTQLDPVELYRSGLSAYKQKRYADAQAYFLAAYNQSDSSVHQILSTRWLGEIALRGWVGSHQFETALTYFENASKQDIDSAIRAESYVRLGEMYYYGLGVPVSQVKAIDYFKRVVGGDEELQEAGIRALPLGALPALYFLQKISRIGGKSETAKLFLDHATKLCKSVTEVTQQRSAETEEVVLAWLVLAKLYLIEGSITTDEARATTFFQNAESYLTKVTNSSQDYYAAEAHYRLGKLHVEQYEGLTKEARPDKKDSRDRLKSEKERFHRSALNHLQKAVSQDSNRWIVPVAHIQLGRLFLIDDRKIPVDKARAFEHYEKARAQSYNKKAQAEATFLLSQLYEKGGESFAADPKKTHEYLKEIADQEYASHYRIDANFLLAQRYYEGTSLLGINLKESYKYFQRVAEESQNVKQLEEARYHVAEMATDRKGGIKRNKKLARMFYDELQKAKNPAYVHRALYRLGEFALQDNDLETAAKNLEIASILTHDLQAKRDAQIALPVLKEKQQKAADKAAANRNDGIVTQPASEIHDDDESSSQE